MNSNLDILRLSGEKNVWILNSIRCLQFLGNVSQYGQAKTLNKVWTMSKSEYLSYLAADDFLLPGAVRTSVEKLLWKPEIMLSYCDFNIVNARSRIRRRKLTPQFSCADLTLRTGPGISSCRDAFQRAGFWNEALRQSPDYDYWLRLRLENRFERIPEALAAHRAHDQSQSFGPVEESRAEEGVNVVSIRFQCGQPPPAIVRARLEAMRNAHIVYARLKLRPLPRRPEA